MTEIADEAGLSRAWLYKNFPDKASLIVAAWSGPMRRSGPRPKPGCPLQRLAAQVAEAVRMSRQPRAALCSS